LAQSGQFSRARVCPLSDQSGQQSILARDGLSAFDPKRPSIQQNFSIIVGSRKIAIGATL
jgi:hypothetical protein